MSLLSIVFCCVIVLIAVIGSTNGWSLAPPRFLLAKKLATAACVAGCFLGFSVTSPANAAVASIKESGILDPLSAPYFSLPSNLGGSKISLKDLAGKKTVLFFFPGTIGKDQKDTAESAGFEKHLGDFKKLGYQVVGVSVDSTPPVPLNKLDLSYRYGLSFPLLSDKGGAVNDKFGAAVTFLGKSSLRQTYVLSADSKIEYVFTDVSAHVDTHADEVLAHLQGISARADTHVDPVLAKKSF